MAAYGAVVFVVPDMLDGCLNMQPMGVADCAPPLTPLKPPPVEWSSRWLMGVVFHMAESRPPLGLHSCCACQAASSAPSCGTEARTAVGGIGAATGLRSP